MVESRSESFPDRLMDNHDDGEIPDHPMDDHDGGHVGFSDYAMDVQDDYGDSTMLIEGPVETDNLVGSGHKESSPLTSSDWGSLGSSGHRTKVGSEKTRRQLSKRPKKGRAKHEMLAVNKPDGRSPPFRETGAGTPPYLGASENTYPHHESDISGSQAQIGTTDLDDLDDLDRKYGTNSDEQYSRYSTRWSSSPNEASGLGARNLEDQHYSLQMRDNTDSYSTRRLEMEDLHRRDANLQSHLHLRGQQDPNPSGSHYLASLEHRYSRVGSHAPLPYVHPAPIVQPSCRPGLPGLQWHTPRAEELQVPQLGYGGSGIFDPSAPPPPHHGHRGVPPGFTPPGFTPPGSRHHPHHSGGWPYD